MYQTKRTHKLISLLLAVVMIFSLLPNFGASAAEVSSDNVIFFATDRHESTSNLNSLLSALAYTPGLVVLGGDHVNDQNSGSLASITSEIQSVYPGVQTFYTYAAHDTNVSEDSSIPYAYARTGEVYEGADYYVYGVDQNDMQSSSNASTASAAFKTWAATADSSKVIFVMCHMPIHSRRGDNAGGATWMTALNEVGESHDIVYLWGHNHTGENSTDTSVYFVARGGSLTPQGGSTGTINFTYMNAGYIKNGYASMVVVNSDTVDVSRYSTSGSVTASYTIERQFAESHVWVATETVEATCDTDGSVAYVCSDCGETKTSVIAATGHSYTSEVVTGCTGTFTRYTCSVCGDTYTEQMANTITYDAATSLVEGESYVIVVSSYALTGGSSITRTSVTVSDSSITSDVADTMVWTYQNGMLYNEAAGGYLYVSSSSSGSSNRPGGSSSSSRSLSISSTGSTVSYSSNKLKIGSYYLYHSNNSGFSGRTSGSSVTLYQVNETVVETGEHTYEITAQSAATCENDGYITYTCTGCGDSYTEVIAATGSHSYVTETVGATCTTAGSVTYTCTVCGDSYVETIAALGHSYEAVVTAPTCTTAGYTTYICACGDSYVANETAALGHTYTTVTVSATCTEAGSVTYTCACGDSYVETIAALGHSYEAVVTAPTCTTAGYTTYTCACGDSYVADEVAALGHEVETVTVDATCTTSGYTAETCVHCGEYTITNETEALGHSYEAVVTAPTCENAGYTTYTCACGDSFIADEVAALGHTLHTVTVDATCESNGSVTTTCTVCGESSVETIAALGHIYETVTVDATCTEDGYTARTCAVCGQSTSEVIAATGHSYETVTVNATCENDGSVTTTCTVCGDSHAEVIAALGHAYASVTVDATCENDGYTTHTCENCGDSYVSDEIAALGHAYVSVTVEATCENAGYTTHTCENCGDSYVSDEIAALGHDYDSVTVDATCESAGYTTYTCACGDSFIADEVAALGHSYSCVESDGYLVYTCDHCGDSYSEEIETGYTYTQVSSLTSGSNYVITLYSGSKYYALSHAGNTISVTEITVSGGQITSEITEDLVWNYNGSTLSYEDGGTTYYLYASRSGGFFSSYKLSLSTSSSSTVSFSSNKIKVGSRYLRYSNGSVSLSSFMSSTAYAFIEE